MGVGLVAFEHLEYQRFHCPGIPKCKGEPRPVVYAPRKNNFLLERGWCLVGGSGCSYAIGGGGVSICGEIGLPSAGFYPFSVMIADKK